MHLKKRLIAVATMCAMVATMIYGSTLKMTNSGDESGRLSWFGDKETIYFWYADDTVADYISSAAVSFGEKEGVRVIPVYCEESQYLEAINEASLYGDAIPDLYMISNDSLEKAYLAGLATQIEDPNEICTTANFPRAAISAVTYQDKLVAYPFFFETTALIYNDTYFQEWARQQAEKEIASVDQEDTENMGTEENSQLDEALVAEKMAQYVANGIPDTVSEILTFADSFDVPETVECIMEWDVSDVMYNYWIAGAYMDVGGDSGDNDANMNVYNEQVVTCMEMYQSLHQFFSIESDTTTYDSVVQDFVEGKTVFTIGTTDIIDKLADAKEDGTFAYEYGIVTMPAVSEELESRSLSITNAIAINGYSDSKELANKFAEYLTREFVDNLYGQTGKAAAYWNTDEANGAIQVFRQEYDKSIAAPKMMETGNFWMQMEVLFTKLWNGEDVNTLLQELSEQMNSQMGIAG